MTKKFIKLFLILFCLFAITACGQSPEKKIIGRWYSEYSVNLPDTNAGSKGTRKEISVSEYFANGGSVLSRRIIVKNTATNPSASPHEIEYGMDVVVSRDWIIKEGKVISKILDVKSKPIYVKRDGVEVSAQELKHLFEKIKKPEDTIPKGQTIQVKIVSLDKDEYIFETEYNGSLVAITTTKTDKSFEELVK